MLKHIVAAITSLFIYGSHPFPASSIQPLQLISEDKANRTICTAFSINEEKGFWATAGHCVVFWTFPEDGKGDPTLNFRDIGIHDIEVEPVFVDVPGDVAVVQSVFHAPTIPLGEQPVIDLNKDLPEVTLYGYMFGQDPTIFKGRIANLHLVLQVPYMVFDSHCGGGHSGSPVLDKHNEVISILQIQVVGGFCGGAPYETMSKLKPYWGD